MATAAQDANSNFESSLRDQLMAAQNGPQPPEDPEDNAPDHSYAPELAPQHGQVDPMIEADQTQLQNDVHGYEMTDMHVDDATAAMANTPQGKSAARRELSGTKRAAQNRAAQRAFRQRKEAYITKLEKQVKDYRPMEDDFRALQHDNYQLREYIAALHNRYPDVAAEMPAPPPPQLHYVGHPMLEQPPNESDGMPHDGQQQQQQQQQLPQDMGQPDMHGQEAPTAHMLAADQSQDPQVVDDGGLPPDTMQQLRAAAAQADQLEANGLGPTHDNQ